jgi:putative DNA primase/helicase
MNALETALRYAAHWPIFPAQWKGEQRKKPLVHNGFYDATQDESIIRGWWKRWPEAIIATPTGRATVVVLDVDVRHNVSGYDTLEEMGVVPLADTPIAHTPSGGVHYYFDPGDCEIRSSAGKIDKGLDLRGEGGYVCLPSPGSGYTWDPHKNFKTTPLAPAPDWLVLSAPNSAPAFVYRPLSDGISPYAAVAINSAVRNIFNADAGAQHVTLNRECFGVGQLVGGGRAPEDVAISALMHAALAMPSYDARRPWRRREVERSVRASFQDGMQRPR